MNRLATSMTPTGPSSSRRSVPTYARAVPSSSSRIARMLPATRRQCGHSAPAGSKRRILHDGRCALTARRHREVALMVKTMVIVLIAAVLGGTGHVLLAKGMRPVGDLIEAPSDRRGGMVARAISNPWLIFGVVLQACFFFIYLTLLSRADVSLVLPLTAVDYIVVALLAQYLLGEIVTPIRWVGMGLIVSGVGLLSKT